MTVFPPQSRHHAHRNACLTYLFIAIYSLVVWAGRHEDISKHKAGPAKSWVVWLISKRLGVQCRSQRPNSGSHPTPLPWTPDTHAVSGSLNINSWEPVPLLCPRASLKDVCILKEQSWYQLDHFPTPSFSSLPVYSRAVGWFLFSAAVGIDSSASIPLWFSESGPMHRGGFPCQINITRVIHWHHSFCQLGPGKVPTILLYLWNN